MAQRTAPREETPAAQASSLRVTSVTMDGGAILVRLAYPGAIAAHQALGREVAEFREQWRQTAPAALQLQQVRQELVEVRAALGQARQVVGPPLDDKHGELHPAVRAAIQQGTDPREAQATVDRAGQDVKHHQARLDHLTRLEETRQVAARSAWHAAAQSWLLEQQTAAAPAARQALEAIQLDEEDLQALEAAALAQLRAETLHPARRQQLFPGGP
jgi:hypothetical protein